MMVCKEDVCLWFKNNESHRRLELLCCLLNMCLPFELHFIKTCLEDLNKRVDFRDVETKVNSLQEIESLSNILDEQTRSRLVVCVALLSATNHTGSEMLFRVIASNHSHPSTIHLEQNYQKEMLLLYTMVLHHPAFTFQQKNVMADQLLAFQQLLKRPVCYPLACIVQDDSKECNSGDGKQMEGEKSSQAAENTALQLQAQASVAEGPRVTSAMSNSCCNITPASSSTYTAATLPPQFLELSSALQPLHYHQVSLPPIAQPCPPAPEHIPQQSLESSTYSPSHHYSTATLVMDYSIAGPYYVPPSESAPIPHFPLPESSLPGLASPPLVAQQQAPDDLTCAAAVLLNEDLNSSDPQDASSPLLHHLPSAICSRDTYQDLAGVTADISVNMDPVLVSTALLPSQLDHVDHNDKRKNYDGGCAEECPYSSEEGGAVSTTYIYNSSLVPPGLPQHHHVAALEYMCNSEGGGCLFSCTGGVGSHADGKLHITSQQLPPDLSPESQQQSSAFSSAQSSSPPYASPSQSLTGSRSASPSGGRDHSPHCTQRCHQHDHASWQQRPAETNDPEHRGPCIDQPAMLPAAVLQSTISSTLPTPCQDDASNSCGRPDDSHSNNDRVNSLHHCFGDNQIRSDPAAEFETQISEYSNAYRECGNAINPESFPNIYGNSLSSIHTATLPSGDAPLTNKSSYAMANGNQNTRYYSNNGSDASKCGRGPSHCPHQCDRDGNVGYASPHHVMCTSVTATLSTAVSKAPCVSASPSLTSQTLTRATDEAGGRCSADHLFHQVAQTHPSQAGLPPLRAHLQNTSPAMSRSAQKSNCNFSKSAKSFETSPKIALHSLTYSGDLSFMSPTEMCVLTPPTTTVANSTCEPSVKSSVSTVSTVVQIIHHSADSDTLPVPSSSQWQHAAVESCNNHLVNSINSEDTGILEDTRGNCHYQVTTGKQSRSARRQQSRQGAAKSALAASIASVPAAEAASNEEGSSEGREKATLSTRPAVSPSQDGGATYSPNQDDRRSNPSDGFKAALNKFYSQLSNFSAAQELAESASEAWTDSCWARVGPCWPQLGCSWLQFGPRIYIRTPTSASSGTGNISSETTSCPLLSMTDSELVQQGVKSSDLPRVRQLLAGLRPSTRPNGLSTAPLRQAQPPRSSHLNGSISFGDVNINSLDDLSALDVAQTNNTETNCDEGSLQKRLSPQLVGACVEVALRAAPSNGSHGASNNALRNNNQLNTMKTDLSRGNKSKKEDVFRTSNESETSLSNCNTTGEGRKQASAMLVESCSNSILNCSLNIRDENAKNSGEIMKNGRGLVSIAERINTSPSSSVIIDDSTALYTSQSNATNCASNLSNISDQLNHSGDPRLIIPAGESVPDNRLPSTIGVADAVALKQPPSVQNTLPISPPRPGEGPLSYPSEVGGESPHPGLPPGLPPSILGRAPPHLLPPYFSTPPPNHAMPPPPTPITYPDTPLPHAPSSFSPGATTSTSSTVTVTTASPRRITSGTATSASCGVGPSLQRCTPPPAGPMPRAAPLDQPPHPQHHVFFVNNGKSTPGSPAGGLLPMLPSPHSPHLAAGPHSYLPYHQLMGPAQPYFLPHQGGGGPRSHHPALLFGAPVMQQPPPAMPHRHGPSGYSAGGGMGGHNNSSSSSTCSNSSSNGGHSKGRQSKRLGTSTNGRGGAPFPGAPNARSGGRSAPHSASCLDRAGGHKVGELNGSTDTSPDSSQYSSPPQTPSPDQDTKTAGKHCEDDTWDRNNFGNMRGGSRGSGEDSTPPLPPHIPLLLGPHHPNPLRPPRYLPYPQLNFVPYQTHHPSSLLRYAGMPHQHPRFPAPHMQPMPGEKAGRDNPANSGGLVHLPPPPADLHLEGGCSAVTSPGVGNPSPAAGHYSAAPSNYSVLFNSAMLAHLQSLVPPPHSSAALSNGYGSPHPNQPSTLPPNFPSLGNPGLAGLHPELFFSPYSHSPQHHGQYHPPQQAPLIASLPSAPASYPPPLASRKPLSCFNCGQLGHRGTECREASIEEMTKRTKVT